MKKIYLFLLLIISVSVQCQPYSILLKNSNWTIVRIHWQGLVYYPPPPLTAAGKVAFNYDENNGFKSTFFNTAGGKVTFGANNAKFFTLQSVGVTLAEYSGENQAAVRQFDDMTTGFYFGYSPSDPFNFEYEEVFSGKNLTVTNPQGNKIFYSNLILGSGNSDLRDSIAFSPNPAKNEFYIKTPKNILGKITVEIFEASGKLVSSQKIVAAAAVDTRALPNGVYVVKATGSGIQFSSKLMIIK